MWRSVRRIAFCEIKKPLLLLVMKALSRTFSRVSPIQSSGRVAGVQRRRWWLLSAFAVVIGSVATAPETLAQRSQLQLEFVNGSPAAVRLMQWNRNGSGRWEDHGFVPAGRVVYKTATSGSQWAFVDPSNNELIESLTAGRFSRQLKIDERDFGGGGHGHGHGHGHGGHNDHGHGGVVQPILVEMHASNHSSQTMFLYRDGGSGSYEYVTTLQAGREYRGNTPVGTVWAFVTPNGNKVIKKLAVNREHNDLEIHNRDLSPPAPRPEPKPQTVGVTFRNMSGQTLEVYHGVPGQRGGHVIGTLRHGQQQVLQAPPNDRYAILRAADHLLVQTYQVPSRGMVVTVTPQMMPGHGGGGGGGGGHGGDNGHDHDHGGGGGVGHGGGPGDHHGDDHADDHGHGHDRDGGLPDPRDLLRRILGGRR